MNDIKIKFTAWIKVVVNRARLDYLRKIHNQGREVFFDDLDERDIRYIIGTMQIEGDLDCESLKSEILLKSDVKLTDTQRYIIERLFVEGKTVQELSACTGWCKQYIYNQKSLALKNFRESLYAKGNE